MIFRNTIRLLLSNFSNVWKLLVYYIICFVITLGVCWAIAAPIIDKLSQANAFSDLVTLLNSYFYQPTGLVSSLDEIINTAWNILSTNIQFTFNYIFLIVWLVFVFPFTLDLAQLALGEVMYGFMTSKVRYGFTGRYIKNIGKSCIFCLVRYLVQFIFNAGIIKLATLGDIGYILLAILLFGFTLCFVSFKHALFSCWMPGIAVLNVNVFRALGKNFKAVFSKFPRIFSNYLALVITALVFNLIFATFTLSVSLTVTLPLTAFVFVCAQMVTYFSTKGMRYYVYQDMVVVPKKFEEQEGIKKLKFLV